jgi:hypothetical protein
LRISITIFAPNSNTTIYYIYFSLLFCALRRGDFYADLFASGLL